MFIFVKNNHHLSLEVGNKFIKSPHLNWLALFSLLALLVPYIYLSFFIHPAADDYNYAVLNINNEWFSEYINQYYTWNGRYSSNCLVLLNPIAFKSLSVYRIIPLLLILFTFLSIYFLVSSVYRKQIEKINRINLALSVTVFYLFVMPNIAEGIYWFTGAVTYQLSVILIITYAALLYRYLNERYLFGKTFHYLLNVIILILIIGFNEIAMLLMLFSHLIFVILSFNKFKKNRLLSIILFFVVLTSSFFVFNAPGNEIRASYFPNNHHFIQIILFSLLQTLRFLFDWVSNLPFILLSILFVIIFIKTKEQTIKLNVFSVKTLVLYSLSIPLVVFLSIFPAYWSTGILGQQRTVNVACFLFILLWLINISLWVDYYKEHPFINCIEKSLKNKYRIILFILAIMAMAITKNGYNSFTDIFYSKAFYFNKEMNERYIKMAEFKNEQKNNLIVNPLQYKPSTIFVLDITNDSSHWLNCGVAAYYGLKEISINK